VRLSRLSEKGFARIRTELSNAGVVKLQELDEALFQIDCACCHAFNMEQTGDPKEMRAEITAALDQADKLLDVTGKLSLYSRLAIDDADGIIEDPDEVDPDTRKYFGAGITGEGLQNLQLHIKVFRRLASGALEEIDVHRGAPVNITGRALALEIRLAFEEIGLGINSYDDGTYMRILEITFEELISDSTPESHRRHGTWALSIADPDNEIDWYTMRRDSQQ